MASYTRQDVGNNIENDEIADATYLDQEFDALAAAFNSSTGHRHNGVTGEGAPITVIGTAQDFLTSGSSFRAKTNNSYDLGTASFKWKDGFFAGTVDSVLVKGSTRVLAGFGTVSLPGFGFVGDEDTGIRRSAENTIDFVTNGVSRMVIEPDGAITMGDDLSVTGDLSVSGTINATVTGVTSEATKLSTPRTFQVTGGGTSSAVPFDGTANVALNITSLNAGSLLTGTVPNARISGSYTNITDLSASGTVAANALSGTTAALGGLTFASADMSRVVGNSVVRINGGINSTDGAGLLLYGGSHPSLPSQSFLNTNKFAVRAQDGTTEFFVVTGSGVNSTIPLSTDSTLSSANITLGAQDIYNRTSNASFTRYNGGNAANTGASLNLFGGTHATLPNQAVLDANTISLRNRSGDNFVIATGSTVTLGSGVSLAFIGTTGRDNTLTNLNIGTVASRNIGSGDTDLRANAGNDAVYLKIASNLGDLNSASSARSNLGLGTVATRSLGTAGANISDNTAGDARWHVQGTDIDVADLPTTAGAATYVGGRTAALGFDEVGSILTLRWSGTGAVGVGATVSSALLAPSSNDGAFTGGTITGNWMCLGRANENNNVSRTTTWKKV